MKGSEDVERQRGSVTVETVVIFPLLIFMFMLVVHYAMLSHADHVVTAAAQDASIAAQAEGGTPQDAEEAAREILGDGRLLHDINVAVERTPDTVKVTVTAGIDGVLPGMPSSVRGESSGSRERFRP